MRILELVLDEDQDLVGIEAISVVENPAIEENFIAFNDQLVQFAKQDDEKRILMGAALIPNKPIYRVDQEGEFYVYFTKDTVRRAMELFFQSGNQANSTLEHQEALTGLTVVESWIIEDPEKDKSSLYNMSLPVGTWMVSVKVDNEKIWNEFVKTGKVKGFSIEGWFVDRMQMSRTESKMQKIIDILKDIDE